jgi:hypothetical protein
MPKEKNPSVRITDQFHGKKGMVYELRCEGTMLSISMIGAKPEGAKVETEWEAEATVKGPTIPLVATGIGPSKGEAFSVLREVWCSQREGMAFPRLDWEAIRQALATVRAL